MKTRLFRASDAPFIRRICVENGGEGAARLPALFARYWLDYYIDSEPRHLWVAEAEDGVVGYLASAFDTISFRTAMREVVLPRLCREMTGRGSIAGDRERRYLEMRERFWSSAHPFDGPGLAKHPAHVHVNVTAIHRGKGAGTSLMEAFLKQARKARVSGFHAETLAGSAAEAFFSRWKAAPFLDYRPFPTEDGGGPLVRVLAARVPAA